MAKRIADKELTDRNWDQEDEGEEASPSHMSIICKFVDCKDARLMLTLG